MTKRCGARNRAGNPCGQPAGWGTAHPGFGHCKLHGGKSPGGVKHAAKAAAAVAVLTYGLPREIEPHAALIEELHRTAGVVAWLEAEIGKLDEDKVTHLIVSRGDHDGNGEGDVIDERINLHIELYQRERKHFVAVAKTCIDVGVEERRVRLAETQAKAWVSAIRAILLEVGVTIDQEVAAVVRRHLSLVA